MVEIGDIYYFRENRVGLDYKRIPVIIYEKNGEIYKGRFTIPGQLKHDYYSLREQDIEYYLEK